MLFAKLLAVGEDDPPGETIGAAGGPENDDCIAPGGKLKLFARLFAIGEDDPSCRTVSDTGRPENVACIGPRGKLFTTTMGDLGATRSASRPEGVVCTRTAEEVCGTGESLPDVELDGLRSCRLAANGGTRNGKCPEEVIVPVS